MIRLTSLPEVVLSYIFLFLSHKEIVYLSQLHKELARIRKVTISVRPPDSQYLLDIIASEKKFIRTYYNGEDVLPNDVDNDNWFTTTSSPPSCCQLISVRHKPFLDWEKEDEQRRINKFKHDRFSLVLSVVANADTVFTKEEESTSESVYIRVRIKKEFDFIVLHQFHYVIYDFPRLHDTNEVWIGVLGGVLDMIVSGAVQEVLTSGELQKQRIIAISVENVRNAISRSFPLKSISFFHSKENEKKHWSTFLDKYFVHSVLLAKYPGYSFDKNTVSTLISSFIEFIAFDTSRVIKSEIDKFEAKVRGSVSQESLFQTVQKDPEYHQLVTYHMKASKEDNKEWILTRVLEGTVEREEEDGRCMIVTEPMTMDVRAYQSVQQRLIMDRYDENTDDIEGLIVVDDLIDNHMRLSLWETICGPKMDSLFTSDESGNMRQIVQEFFC